jgi:putative solute:sodium symporter small subunit
MQRRPKGERVAIEPDAIVQGGERRQRLPWVALIAWVLFAFTVTRASQSLNAAKVFGFPLGYLMMAQGSLLALLVVAVLSAQRQGRREDHRGAASPEPR